MSQLRPPDGLDGGGPSVASSGDLAGMERENAALRARVEEAEDTLRALRGGEIDAIVVGDDIYTLEAAEAAANRFRSDVLAQMREAVVALDDADHVIYLNHAAELQYGVRASQALGRSRDHLYTQSWVKPADAAGCARALAGIGFWRGRTRHRTRAGASLLVEITLSRLRDNAGNATGVLVVARDMSDQALAEAALRESRARLHFALESARVGEWELELQTGETRRSLRHDQCFGYREAVALWSRGIFLAHVHIDDRARVDAAFDAAVGGTGDLHFECRVIWPNASEHWIEMHATVFADAGQARRMVGIVSDITERKRAETELRVSDERKDVFLATLAHELRNPLAPIRNSVQIMRMTRDPQALERAMTTVERQLQQMVHLVDDLMDVSRISQGKMDLRRELIDISAVLHNAVDTARPLFDRKRHALVLQLPEQPARVDADMTRLTQVVANLLDNAGKYTPEGGRITLSAAVDGSEVVVGVLDTGVGIHPAMLPHVFDLFTQVSRTRGSAQGGMGIGLALVKTLVEMHGGSVEACSAGEGLGAEVRLRLPLALPAADSAAVADGGLAPGAPPAQSTSTGCRVLVAEDNADSAESMAMLLRLLGHEAAVAPDGAQAVAVAESFRPRAVLMDIGLPVFDGYEAARRIRAQPWGRDMVLVALTGWGQDADRERSRAAGLDHHLVKPVDPARLVELLKQPRSTSP